MRISHQFQIIQKKNESSNNKSKYYESYAKIPDYLIKERKK